MQSMILAAGLGTRLLPYTNIRPKPLFPVLDAPLLKHLLDMVRKTGCRKTVVNCHHLAGQVRRFLESEPDVQVQFEPEILGTGGSLRQALSSFTDRPVLVMNGDLYHGIDLTAVYRHHLQSGNKVTLALHDYPRFNSVRVDQDRVIGFLQGNREGGDCLAFTGIHVIEPEIIGMIPAGKFHHIIDLYRALAEDRQRPVGLVRVDSCYWRDMGTPEDYLALHRDLLAGRNESLGSEVPERGGWQVAVDAEIGKDVRLDEWGCIGSGAIIGAGARLTRCVVWDGATVPSGGHYIDCILAE